MSEIQNSAISEIPQAEVTILGEWPNVASSWFKVYSKLTRFYHFFRRIGMNPIHFILPSLLALLATIFEGISVGLLIPTLKGLIDQDYNFARETPVLKGIFSFFPESFIQQNVVIFILIILFIFAAAVTKSVLQYISSIAISFQVKRLARNLRKLIYERYLSF